jgi:predicted SAM-dependent methyltransferase
MKLNLGCGKDIKEGFWNVDVVYNDGVDVVMDLSIPELPFKDVEYINCQDLIEHFYKDVGIRFLKECYRILNTGGKMYIQTPDLEILCKRYCGVLENPTSIQHNLNGEQIAQSLYAHPNIYDSHKWCYDKFTLGEVLESIGFEIESIGSDGGQNLLCLAIKK